MQEKIKVFIDLFMICCNPVLVILILLFKIVNFIKNAWNKQPYLEVTQPTQNEQHCIPNWCAIERFFDKEIPFLNNKRLFYSIDEYEKMFGKITDTMLNYNIRISDESRLQVLAGCSQDETDMKQAIIYISVETRLGYDFCNEDFISWQDDLLADESQKTSIPNNICEFYKKWIKEEFDDTRLQYIVDGQTGTCEIVYKTSRNIQLCFKFCCG